MEDICSFQKIARAIIDARLTGFNVSDISANPRWEKYGRIPQGTPDNDALFSVDIFTFLSDPTAISPHFQSAVDVTNINGYRMQKLDELNFLLDHKISYQEVADLRHFVVMDWIPFSILENLWTHIDYSYPCPRVFCVRYQYSDRQGRKHFSTGYPIY